MIAPLLNFPLLLFLAVVPLTILAATVLRNSATTSQSVRSVLIAAALIPLAALFFGQLLYAFLYLGSPGFTDHIEPNTAIVSWIYSQGGQIYHALDASERYAFLYGPVPYIATSWMYVLLGPGVLAAKLAGFICLLISIVFLILSVRQRFANQLIPCIVALGYFSLVALFFKNHSFWSKPDPFMIAAAAAGLFACVLHPAKRRLAWIICGVALGVSANAKITGIVYFLPYLAWFFDRDGYRAPLVILPAAACVGLLPFWSVESVSLINYLAWLQAAGSHGISGVLLVQNTVFLLFIMAPVGLYLLWQGGSLGIRSWFATRRLVVAASVAAALLILIAASKPGSGPHHFLPFLPVLAFLTAYAVSRVYSYRPATNWGVYGFWAPLTALLIAASLKATVALYYGLEVVAAQTDGAVLVAELDTIVADNPGHNIYMGYGDGSRYVTTFARPALAYAGQPYLVDAPAMMDFQFSGIGIPEATIARLLTDDSAIWLIPVGQEPFTIVNWYYRRQSGLLFDEAFRAAFRDNFEKQESTTHFDLYVPVGRKSLSP